MKKLEKLQIKNFAEIENQELTFPLPLISGANESGKTSKYRALLYCLCLPDIDGSAFTGAVYSVKKEKIINVAVVIDGEEYRIISTPKRVKIGEKITTDTSLNNAFYIDNKEVTKREYTERLPKNLSSIICPEFFLGDATKLREFFVQSFDIQEYDRSAIDGLLREKNIAGQRYKDIEAIKKNEILKLEKIEKEREVDNSGAILELTSKIKKVEENKPTFTKAQLLEIEEKNIQINDLRKKCLEEIGEMPALHKITEISPELSEKSAIENEIITLKNQLEKEKTNLDFEKVVFTPYSFEDERRLCEEYQRLANIIENYDEKGKICKRCPVCDVENCTSKITEVMPLSYYTEKINQIPEPLRISLSSFSECIENQINKEKRDFEEKLEKKIQAVTAEYENKIKIKQEELINISEKIEKIKIGNKQKEEENQQIRLKFEEDKEKITRDFDFEISKIELSKPILSIQEIDLTEDYTLLKKLEEQQKIYNDNIATEIFTKKEIEKTTKIFEEISEEIYNIDMNISAKKKEEALYYLSETQRINDILKDNGISITIDLFERNISNENYFKCFNIRYLDNKNLSGARSAFERIKLCRFFAKSFNIDFPTFCDEAGVFDKENLTKIKKLQQTENLTLLLPE